MKLRVNRYTIEIIPEDNIDEAYIEEVLGLKENHQNALCTRINSIGLSCIAYIQIKKQES